MNSDDKNKEDSILSRVLERTLITFVIALLTILFLVWISTKSHAADVCLTAKIDPSNVYGNYDGDTFAVSLGALGIVSVRVAGVDTPERNKKQPGWEAARAFTTEWLKRAPFSLSTCFEMTLNRIVGTPYRGDEKLSEALIKAGLGKPMKE